MATPVQVGSPVDIITLSGAPNINAGSGSLTGLVDVPATTELIVAHVVAYRSTAGETADAAFTFTKGGSQVAMVKGSAAGCASTSAYQHAIYWQHLPDTGTGKTFAWTWPGGTSCTDGGRMVFSFWKDMDATTPVRDSAGGQAGSLPWTTGTLSAPAGDVIVASCGGYNNASPASIDSWTPSAITSFFQRTTAGSGEHDYTLASGVSTGTTTVAAATATGFADGGVVAISLKPSVAGGAFTLTADQASFTLSGQAATLRIGPWDIVGVGTSVQVTAATHTLTLPAGVQQGDLLVAVIASRIASTTSITLPSGGEWTACAEQKTNNVLTTGSAVASGLMAYCIRGASDPNLTFTHPTAPSVALGRIVAYRGSYVGGWLDQSTSATTAISTTAVSVSGVTTSYPNDLIVVGLCGGQEAAWSAVDATNPSVASGATDTTTRPTANTWIERADVVTTTGSDTSLAIADGVRAAAGATGNITATASVAAAHVVLVAAFRPLAVSLAPYTLTADQASFTLNGQTAGLKYGQVLTAAQGAFALTGQTATLRQGYVLTAAQGAFALTGQTATLRRGRVPLVAAQGSFLLNGQTATLRRGRVPLAAAQGAFALTGQTATLKRSTVMPAAQGAFTLTGFAATLVDSGAGPKTMVAGTGLFALTGQPATLRVAHTLTAAQGAFALTGQTATLRRGRVPLVAAQGSFLLNGQAAILRYGQKLIAAQGAFTLTGQTATLKRARVMPATFGSFALSGPAVILDYSGEGAVEMPAGVGIFALTGQTATLRYNRKGVSAQGAFALTGQTALLKRSRVTPAATGMFAFTGQTVNLLYTPAGGYTLDADPGTFALAGQLVELTRTVITAPPLLEAQPGRLNFGRKVSIRRW